jgi:hypothetical protein
MNSRFTLSLFLCFALTSCNPYVFELQRLSGWPIEGRILSSKDNVDVGADNVLRVTNPAVVAVRTEQITDGMFDTELKWVSAGDVELVFRSTPYDDSTSSTNAVNVRLGFRETIVTYGDSTYRVDVPTPVDGTPFRLRVVQHGNVMDVVVGCTLVAHLTTRQPSTQWLSIRPNVGTAIEFRDPKFLPLTDEFSRVSYP